MRSLPEPSRASVHREVTRPLRPSRQSHDGTPRSARLAPLTKVFASGLVQAFHGARASRRLGWAGFALLVACGGLEERPQGTPCVDDVSCPSDRICYRGYCVQDDESSLSVDDAGALPGDAGSLRAVAPDAGSASTPSSTPPAATAPSTPAPKPDAGSSSPPAAPPPAAPPPAASPPAASPPAAPPPSAMPDPSGAPDAGQGQTSWPAEVLACVAVCTRSGRAAREECRACLGEVLSFDFEAACSGVTRTAAEEPICSMLCVGGEKARGGCDCRGSTCWRK